MQSLKPLTSCHSKAHFLLGYLELGIVFFFLIKNVISLGFRPDHNFLKIKLWLIYSNGDKGLGFEASKQVGFDLKEEFRVLFVGAWPILGNFKRKMKVRFKCILTFSLVAPF